MSLKRAMTFWARGPACGARQSAPSRGADRFGPAGARVCARLYDGELSAFLSGTGGTHRRREGPVSHWDPSRVPDPRWAPARHLYKAGNPRPSHPALTRPGIVRKANARSVPTIHMAHPRRIPANGPVPAVRSASLHAWARCPYCCERRPYCCREGHTALEIINRSAGVVLRRRPRDDRSGTIVSASRYGMPSPEARYTPAESVAGDMSRSQAQRCASCTRPGC